MPDKTFDLGDYVTVPERIALFYELFAQGRLVTTNVQLTTEPDGKPRVMVEAAAYRTADDPLPGRGWSWMLLPGTSNFTRGSELENAETSAWGRAIASLGILTAGGIASRQEVKSKADDGASNGKDEGAAEQRTTHRDGLIGKAIAQGTQDFGLRTETADGIPWLPFRIKDGKLSQIAVAKGPIATALNAYREEALNQRVQVWGHYTDESYDKKNKADEWETITFKVLHVERIKTPAFEIPADGIPVEAAGVMPDGTTMTDEPPEAPSAPLWEPLTEDEQALVGGGLPG